ncbi:hypothetical protein ML462_15280 [Gramella lutea]|uniref:Uncharacterized protein n=1 Tax=Christiangramia lutea TaxID=1607951 RepID=A0A9X1V7P2_9FLAO|nr:hypothetical protein [Christiangramia lutea]MCH4824534.1 hypothetical protein [Christiangramia lutea]
MKRLILVLLIISLYSCSKNKSTEFKVYKYLPKDSEMVIISQDMGNFIKNLSDNDLVTKSGFPLKDRFSKELSRLKELNFKHETAIAFSGLGSENIAFTLVTKKDSSLLSLDSIKNKSVETFKQKNLEFKNIKFEDTEFFMFEAETTSIISNSRENLIESGKIENPLSSQNFQKAYHASSPEKTTIFYNHNRLGSVFKEFFQKLHFPAFTNFAEWSILDLDFAKNQIRGNGISLGNQESASLNLFKNTSPQQSETSAVCPEDFISFLSLNYENFENLYESPLKSIDSTTFKYPEVLDVTREATAITFESGEAFVLNAKDIELAKEALAGLGDEIETFRGSSIFELNDPLDFKKSFSKILEVENGRFYTFQDHFVIFSTDLEILKNIIAAIQNSDTLKDKAYFTNLMSTLSSESSMLFVINSSNYTKANKPEFNKNSLAALQIIIEDDFAHLHTVISNSEEAALSNGPEQVASFKIDAPVSTTPYFFKNHRTDQMDISVQDEDNNIYLISNKGTVFWKKKMDSQITSPIYQVDLFKNGNQQLAFSTGYHMEVLDRNGNKVKGYPIQFNSPLTQPLSVFDYDNNRNYRFVLTQNKRVYMVGPRGKAIKGFDFESAGSEVIKPPKHIRLGNKDYILVAEKSGKLNILSRQGDIRVPVKGNIDYSENEWYGYQNSFVSTKPKSDLIKISQNGNISSSDLGLAENNRIVADRTNLVYLNENELSINSRIVNLDFGLYSDPQLFNIRNRTLVAITDTQTQKVYVFNDKAELLEGFPVYGTSQVDIANADLDSKLELVVKGEENEILMYKF